MTFMVEITKHLNKLGDVCDAKNPDAKHNVGRLLGVAFFWTKLEGYAKAKKEETWAMLQQEGIVADDCKSYDPGEYSLAESPSFYAQAKVSNPVKRFNEDALATALNKKYRVPLPTAKEMINAAKLPSTSTVTKSIVER